MSDKKKDPAADAPAKGRPGWLMPALAAAVALVAGVATAFTPLVGGGKSASHEEAAHEEAPASESEEFGTFITLESLVVNPRDTNGRHYLMVQLGADTAKPEAVERMKEIAPAANDAVLDLLSHKTIDELSDIARRDTLKEELRTTLNGLLGAEGPVRKVYFIQYVIQ